MCLISLHDLYCDVFTDQKPTLKDQEPRLKELQKYVIPHVGPKWEDLGIELELDDDDQLLDEIKRDRRGDEEKCCLDVVRKWLQGAGPVEPRTWRKLLECLREIDATDAINSIEANILTGRYLRLIILFAH